MKCTWLPPFAPAPFSYHSRVSPRPLQIPLDSLDSRRCFVDTVQCAGGNQGCHVICSFSPSAPVNVLFEYYYFDSLASARLSVRRAKT